jgi:hypothetical protein
MFGFSSCHGIGFLLALEVYSKAVGSIVGQAGSDS